MRCRRRSGHRRSRVQGPGSLNSYQLLELVRTGTRFRRPCFLPHAGVTVERRGSPTFIGAKEENMADDNALRKIGYGFGTVTFAVMVAALLAALNLPAP